MLSVIFANKMHRKQNIQHRIKIKKTFAYLHYLFTSINFFTSPYFSSYFYYHYNHYYQNKNNVIENLFFFYMLK